MGMGATQGGTTTTTNAPYTGFQPYIGTALGQAGNLLQSGGPQYYPGQQVASFNPIQNRAFGGISAFDQNLLKGQSNPYLSGMFNQAADATQNRLASEFAGGGQDVGAGAALRGQQLNNLATDIYGGQYQNTINNAMNAGNQMLGIGNQIQGQSQNLIDASKNAYNYNQNLPYANLQRFEGAISGLMPGTGQQSNPYFTNPSANFLGSALAAQQLYNGFGGSGGGSKGGGGEGGGGGGGSVGGFGGSGFGIS